MPLPAETYLYEFLYRGQPDTAGDWHVILAAPQVAAFTGQTTIAMTQAMTPDQAAAAGFPLPAALAAINAAALSELTSARETIAAMHADEVKLTGEIGALTAQLAAAKASLDAATATTDDLRAALGRAEAEIAALKGKPPAAAEGGSSAGSGAATAAA